MFFRRKFPGQATLLLTLLICESVLAADADREAGKLAYNQCIGCHSFAYHRTGPKHCNLIGRIAGTAKNFEYSDAMHISRVVWSRETLNDFLASPLTYMPGTSMGFIGVKNSDQRMNLVEYLVHQSESDQCDP